MQGVERLEAACKVMAASVADIYALPQDGAKRELNIRALYSPSARWADPLTEVHGLDGIIANFRAYAMLCSNAKVEIVHATFSPDREGGSKLRFESVGIMGVRFTPFKLKIRMWTVLSFSAQTGQIVDHTDHWSLESFISNVPIFGFVYDSIFRPALGALVSKVLGSTYSPLPQPASWTAPRLPSSRLPASQVAVALPSPSATSKTSSSSSGAGGVPTGAGAPSYMVAESLQNASLDDIQNALKNELRKYADLKRRSASSSPGTGSPLGSLGALQLGTSPGKSAFQDVDKEQSFTPYGSAPMSYGGMGR